MGGSRLLEIVERAYDVDAPERAWLESIRKAAEQAFPGALETQAYTYSLSPAGAFRFGQIASDAHYARWMRQSHDLASPAVLRQVYFCGPVTSVDQAIASNEEDAGAQCYASRGVHVTGVHGLDPSGAGCSLAILRDRASLPSRRERGHLERIAAHLAAARRLRSSSLDRPGRTESCVNDADAVVSADGLVIHAEGDARAREARSALCDAARRIDRARARKGASSPEEALALWRALVEGRWSLVERFDTDGRRLFVARRNDPASRTHHALSELERKVVALVALGHSQKMCAYELGRCEGTVSSLARSAMRKLGVRTRGELVELYGAIVEQREALTDGSRPSAEPARPASRAAD